MEPFPKGALPKIPNAITLDAATLETPYRRVDVSACPTTSAPPPLPQLLSKKVEDLLGKGCAREAIQETLLALASDGNGGSRLDLTLLCFRSFPMPMKWNMPSCLAFCHPF
ncbi:MAG: hypothetical protein LLG04_00735 [Parachlamydia sp.]|nr:hypothetical protein [Parachlamydia sp.]